MGALATASGLTVPGDFDRQLADEVARCYADPLRFVRTMFPWGEPDTVLAQYRDVDTWQADVLRELGRQVKARRFNGKDAVPPIRLAISSAHGVGKTALMAWIALWLLSTRPHCRGTVTANTFDQLTTKTWAAVRQWHQLVLPRHWFEANSSILYRKGYRESWFCGPASCAEENSEAFAGQHAATSTSFFLFDEGSAVPDKIYEVAEGGLTDGEPFIAICGNPTRNTGKLYRAVFGSERERWTSFIIDGRTCALTNKALIQEWIDDYSLESDFVRVRVRGLAPLANELQYLDAARIAAAQQRQVSILPDDPIIAGVDVSGGGSAKTVCWFRQGLDARSRKPIVLTGEQSQDRNQMVSVLAEQCRVHRLAAMFLDQAYGAAVADRLRALGFHQVHEVNFGGAAADHHYENVRAAMWGKLKDWLERGAIPADPQLAVDLAGPGYHLTKSNKLALERKEAMRARGVASPDRGDALALTFAFPVHPAVPIPATIAPPRSVWG